MKKYFLLILAAVFFATGTVYALSPPDFVFNDDAELADWSQDAVYNLWDTLVITGYDDNTFRPNEFVTRQEVAVLLDRYGGLYLNLKMNEFFEENIENQEVDPSDIICTADSVPGAVLYIQNQNGEPISDATVSVSQNADIDNLIEVDFYTSAEINPGKYTGLYEDSGYHHLVIEKEGHSTHRETIILEGGDCHVITQGRTITLFELD